jgi:hypothetical protein
MKLAILPILVLATIPALSQNSDSKFPLNAASSQSDLETRNPEIDMRGCEVKVAQASFDRPARLLQVGSGAWTTPSLSVQLEEESAKAIVAVDLVALLKVKENIYQLDSTTRAFPLHVRSMEGAQRLQVAESAVGFDSVLIEQVTYRDGTTWRPAHRHACGYSSSRSIEQVAK